MSSKAAGKQDAKFALTPKLRFPEFRDAAGWPVQPLGSFTSLSKGEQLDASDKDEGGRYPHYNGGISPSSSTHKANRDANTIIISEGGNSCGYVQFIPQPFWSGGHCYSLEPRPQVNTLTLFFALQAKQRDIMALRIGSGLPNIQKSTLLKFDLAFPKLDHEQQKIAECLTTLDEMIAAQSQKLDALKTHKKGLMQLLLPREGETLPRLRFLEFQEPWRVGTVGDLATTVMGNAFKSTDFVESGTQVIRIGNLYQGELQLDRAPVYLSDDQAKENLKFILNPADLLMSMTGTVGKRDYGFVIQVPADCEPLLLNQRVMKLAPTHNCHAGYLLQLLKDERLLDNLYSMPGGTKQANLSAQAVKSLAVSYPQKPEQQRIATCLTSLDDLITAQSAKLEALKTHKRGLMQQLFPSPEEVGA